MGDPASRVKVVLFTGGRGSSVLSSELIKSDQIDLTLAINGYDDGLSTGEVRRFLGDSLGPSDFRKNGSWVAARQHTCDERLISLLDLRLPDPCTTTQASACFQLLRDRSAPATTGFDRKVQGLAGNLEPALVESLVARLDHFEKERTRTGTAFAFGDCSIGNLVFAGCFLHVGRNFNAAVDDYCSLLGLTPGMIENVTDGRNACLVAVDGKGRLLATEAEIVTADEPQNLKDIYLLDRLLTAAERQQLERGGEAERQRVLSAHALVPAPNPRLLEKIAGADLIVYAPGTQHSSLFPSYLTPGIGTAIARNLKALKVLITNLHEDAEISGNSAVDLIDKALFYLREKGKHKIPTPCLITHYVLNDPARTEARSAYVPLGSLESLEDPRLVRIGNYEDGVTGRHDATKVLTPFIKSFLRRRQLSRVAVVLLDDDSPNKVSQTLVEMIRAGIDEIPVEVTVFCDGLEWTDREFLDALPFEVRRFATHGAAAPAAFARLAQDPRFEYLMFFESSGMYRGEDIVNLARHLAGGRMDAVWGSRRLSVNDIRQAYRLVYRHKSFKAFVSYLGSHLLSLSYLVLYGRYISDTLSGARVIRSSFLREDDLFHHLRDFNQIVLSNLLRQRAEIFETPVYYFPISPEKVRRTTVLDGVRSLLTILKGRWRRLPAQSPPPASRATPAPGTPAFGTEAASLPK
jgi:2-phospho-L-lactate transferase/gluconeogenesis factor (CofD/UPF0052 family)